MRRFFDIKNITQNSADIYIYGAICLEKERDWWTGEPIESDTDVYLMDFKKALDDLGNISLINLYVNSPGGDVFVASTMISLLRRVKDKGTKIDVYIDALAASAASFLIMIADDIHIYKNSMLMVHKPMTWGYGNSLDLQKIINELEQIEDNTMLPMYMSKTKDGITEEEVKTLIANESWLGAKEIEQYFNVIVEDEEKEIAACTNKNIFARYKHVPEELAKNIENEVEETIQNPEDNQTVEQKPEENQATEQKPEENQTENIENNLEKEAIIRNKLNLVKASLFIKEKKKN